MSGSYRQKNQVDRTATKVVVARNVQSRFD